MRLEIDCITGCVARKFLHYSHIVLGAGHAQFKISPLIFWPCITFGEKIRLYYYYMIWTKMTSYEILGAIMYSISIEITSWICVRVSNFYLISSKWLCSIDLWSDLNSADIFWILAKCRFHRRIAQLCGIYTTQNKLYIIGV